MTLDSRRRSHSSRRLQFVLLVMILWDALAVIAELSFGGPLFKIDGENIGGFLAARGSFGGAAVVTLVMYTYALVRGPARHTGVLWAGVIEQAATALFAVYHVTRGDIELEGAVLPLVVSCALLVVLMLHLPRQQVPA